MNRAIEKCATLLIIQKVKELAAKHLQVFFETPCIFLFHFGSLMLYRNVSEHEKCLRMSPLKKDISQPSKIFIVREVTGCLAILWPLRNIQFFSFLRHLGIKLFTFSENQANTDFKTILYFNLWWKYAIVMLWRKRE